jgi:aspartate 1-decarboxylase
VSLAIQKTEPLEERRTQTEVESAASMFILHTFPLRLKPLSNERMQFYLLKSKIHRATVTGGNIRYEGSLTIASDLMKLVGMVPYERILCSNMENGNRFETYAIPGEPGSGAIILNGAAAHMGKKGDSLTIMSFTTAGKKQAGKWKPRIIVLGKNNSVVNRRGI